MKQRINAAAVLMLAGLVLLTTSKKSPAQSIEPGPGAGGSVLKDPYAPRSTQPQSAPVSQPNYVENLIDKNAPQEGTPHSSLEEKLRSLAPSSANKINDDIKITPSHGPYVIYIQSYTGEDCHQLARQMVTELRGIYKLHAYTFNKGAEEKQKEYARVMEIIEKQKERYEKNGIPSNVPIRVGFMHLEEQCAVILGGYQSEESALRAVRNEIRNLKPLDPTKVMLDKRVFYSEEKNKKTEKREGYVNPFLGAFVAPNPTIKQKRPDDWKKTDMALLQTLNANEPNSLLNCKKPYTLAVKYFKTPSVLQDKESNGSSFWDNMRLGNKFGHREDAAATSAHNLVELLRKAKLEAYVLHAKYTSIVCVGGFDSPDDPALKHMTNVLETKVLPQISQLFPTPPNQAVAEAKVVAIPIPR